MGAPGVSKPEVGVYDRNRREVIPQGTREVSVISIVLSITLQGRKSAEERNRRIVIEAFEKEWGQPPASQCVITHTHLSCQLLTTLRVAP